MIQQNQYAQGTKPTPQTAAVGTNFAQQQAAGSGYNAPPQYTVTPTSVTPYQPSATMGSIAATPPSWRGAPPPAPAAPAAPASTAPGEGYGPGFGEQYGMAHVGQYDAPTSLEQFAQSQLTGTNPYYARIQQQGLDAINQQMAARGHYNSGGALSALGNFTGQLGAQQFQDMGNLLGSAGQMGLQREQQGNAMATGVQTQQQQRLQNQWSNLSDLAHLGAGNVGGFYGQGGQLSGDAAMSGINAGANAAQLTGQGQQALPDLAMSGLNAYLGGGKK